MRTAYVISCVAALLIPLTPHSFGEEKLSPLEIDRLMRQLSSDDWILQGESLQRLGRSKIDTAAPAIANLLSEQNAPWLRGQALLALARIRGEGMLPAAKAMSQSTDSELRKAAVEALDVIGTEPATAAARDLLSDPELAVRVIVAAICAKRYPDEAWRALEGASDQPNVNLCGHLARAFAAIGTEESLARVDKLFHGQGNEELRLQILRGLAAADETAVPLLLRLTLHYRPGNRSFEVGRDALASRDRQKVSAALLSALASEEADSFGPLAHLASEVCPSQPLEDAIVAAWKRHEDLPPETVRSGLAALTRIDPSRHVGVFRKYLNDEDSKTRAAAVQCRALCDAHGLFEEFRPHMTDPDQQVVRTVLRCLNRVPEGFVPFEGIVAYLEQPLQSRDSETLVGALALLSDRGTRNEFPKALKALSPALGSGDVALQTAAAKVLEELGGADRVPAIVAAQGYISQWKLIGTFPNDSRNSGFETAYPPEKETDFAKTYASQYRWDFEGGGSDHMRELLVKWTDARVTQVDGTLNVAAAMPVPTRYGLAYGVADIVSDEPRAMLVVVTTESPIRLWLNNKQLADPETSDEPYRITLLKGRNRLRVKTTSKGGRWVLGVQLLDAQGKATPGVRQVSMESADDGATRE